MAGNLLQRIVTPAFITLQAHLWFAYAVVHTFYHPAVIASAVAAAGVKEFYVDKHFEVDQSFNDNLQDFGGYVAGVLAAVLAHHFLH